ncbi:hypothetical protein NITUZ_10045 [Candidatus Nitrosotenuis uzonensis]|uniref:Uncharacterized protein n=1 Tax=Candidatus Nitrosotenuis uzonensis TaxID=1407055 RepID=V6AQM6_9ARCH|nr:hypothetical protein NITUZ_10045 [Candidatus Nitrosotenuis uzonensis]
MSQLIRTNENAVRRTQYLEPLQIRVWPITILAISIIDDTRCRTS